MKEEYNIIQIFLATNGEIKYKLVTQPDSTRTWESIKIKTINNGKTKRNDN
jgi:hypothetical protein